MELHRRRAAGRELHKHITNRNRTLQAAYGALALCLVAASLFVLICWCRVQALAPPPEHNVRAQIATPTALSAAWPQSDPDFMGLATWYGEGYCTSRKTRSGEAFDPQAFTCAVPHEWWPALAGKWLRIQLMDGARSIVVRVNDSGYLSEAGRFTWGIRRVGQLDVARWWPDENGLPIVVDLTQTAHWLLTGDGETVAVRVWCLPESPQKSSKE